MTFRVTDAACARALVALTREAAQERAPELDWERIESGLRRAEATSPLPRVSYGAQTSMLRFAPRPPRFASTPWPIGIAAAAAAALIALSGPRPPVAASHTRASAVGGAQRSASALGGALLAIGEVAETGAQSVVYDEPDVVRFALAPNSRMEVIANDAHASSSGGITVALSRGSLHADVEPRAQGEIFAVEVERTRVAVHGTSFTVAREGDRVMVDVAHGSVAVGPVGHRGATHGWLVVGPDRAAFSLDGAREATWLGPAPAAPEAARDPAIPAVAVPPADERASHGKRVATAPRAGAANGAGTKTDAQAAAARVAAKGEPARAEARDPSQQERAEIAAIVGQLESCYEKQATSYGVRFTIESSLELTIMPNGAVRDGLFTPPLSPTLMSCANRAIAEARFAKSDAVRTIRIPVQLARPAR